MAELPINFDCWLMQKSEEGFEEARIDLMKITLAEIENAKFENICIKEFLIYAFKEIVNGKSADKALLQKSSGIGKKTKSFKASKKDFEIAVAVFNKRLEPGKKKTLEICYREAAREFTVSPAKAKQLYMKLQGYIKEDRKMRAEYDEERTNQPS